MANCRLDHGNVSGPAGGTITVDCLDSSTDDTMLEGAQIKALQVSNLSGTVIALKPHTGAKASARPSH